MFHRISKSARFSGRTRSFSPTAEVLEGRPLMSAYLQASDTKGGGVYGIDVLGGLAHNQDGMLLSTHLDGLGITTISSGTTKAGLDDVFVQAAGSSETYYATPGLLGLGGGFVDQHVALKQFENLPGGRAYGIDFNGALYHYQEGVTNGIGGGSWTKVGGGGILNISARTLANGQDAVFMRTVGGGIVEWKASTGFVDLHAGMASVYASPTGNYSVGYDGSVYFYSDAAHAWGRVGGSNIAEISVGTTSSGQEDFYARTATGHLYYGNPTAIVPIFGLLQNIVATSNGGAYGIGYDGSLYHNAGVYQTFVGGSGIDSVAPGIDAAGQDEVYVHYSVINLVGVKVGMVGKYQPSAGAGITPILDLLA